MAIRTGEVARLRVTGEDVFVLALGERNFYGVPTQVAYVRRPTSTKGGGIEHSEDVFTLAELETPEDYRTRTLAERVAMQAKVMQSGGSPSQEALRDLFEVQ